MSEQPLPGFSAPPEPEVPPDEELFSEIAGETLQEQQPHIVGSAFSPTEAPASFYTVLHTKDGGWMSMTVRGIDPIQTMESFLKTRSIAMEKYGMNTTQSARAEQTGLPIPPQTVPPNVAGQTLPPAPPPQTAEQASLAHQPITDDNTGSFEIRSIVVLPIGGVEFNIGPFKYPVKDSRSPSKIATIFDKGTGIDEAWLSVPKVLEPGKFGQIWMADWEKVTKPSKKTPGQNATYYNIKRVWVKAAQPIAPTAP